MPRTLTLINVDSKISRSGESVGVVIKVDLKGKVDRYDMTASQLVQFLEPYEILGIAPQENGQIVIVGRKKLRCVNCDFWVRDSVHGGECINDNFRNARTLGDPDKEYCHLTSEYSGENCNFHSYYKTGKRG